MKTTVELDDQVARELQELAAQEHRTVDDLFNEAARSLVARLKPTRSSRRVVLPTAGDAARPLSADQVQRAIEDATREDDLRGLGF